MEMLEESHSAQSSPGECWICLETGPGLVQPCACPHLVHPRCLARWQLQSAGKFEERKCLFCRADLADWRTVLCSPPDLPDATPVVSVHYGGKRYRIRVKPGPEGLAKFRKQLKKITGRDDAEAMRITFQCKAPGTTEQVSLHGLSAFDAAMHCAAVSSSQRALRRMAKQVDPANADPAPEADEVTAQVRPDAATAEAVAATVAESGDACEEPAGVGRAELCAPAARRSQSRMWLMYMAGRVEGWARKQEVGVAAFTDRLSLRLKRLGAAFR